MTKCMKNNVKIYVRGFMREVMQIIGLERLEHDLKILIKKNVLLERI